MASSNLIITAIMRCLEMIAKDTSRNMGGMKVYGLGGALPRVVSMRQGGNHLLTMDNGRATHFPLPCAMVRP